MRIRRKLIVQRASELLELADCSKPPIDVEQIADFLGIRVLRSPDASGHSGFLLMGSSSKTPIIGVNSTQSPVRQRFTIAHEIGHFVLHRSLPLHVDEPASFRIERRSHVSTRGDDPKEIEANAFAAELLMPRQALSEDVEDSDALLDLTEDEDLSSLANRYQVSAAAMTFRLANLGYISL